MMYFPLFINHFYHAFEQVQFMAPTTGVLIAAALACMLLVASGFASGSEIAFFSLTPSDINELEDSRLDADQRILNLREDSERTLATILITNNLVNVTIIMLCNYVFAHIVDFGNSYWLQFICITVLLTFILLLFGEIIPKVYSGQQPLAFCRRAVGGIYLCRRIFHPFATILLRSGILASKVVQKENKMLTAEAKSGKSIIYQHLTITRLDAYYFEYAYGGSSYQGVLLNGEFHPGKISPISEHAEVVMDNTERYMSRRMFPQAWHHSNIASDMNVYGTRSRASRLLAIAKRKMTHLHEMGAAIAFILMLLFGVPCIYHFYDVYNPVLKFMAHANDPNTMGYDYYPMSMTLLSIVIMWLVYLRCKLPLWPKLYYATTKLNTIGVLWGFVSFTLLSALALVVADLIVALGGSLLVEWVVGFVLWLLKVALMIVVVVIMLAWELISWLWGLFF